MLERLDAANLFLVSLDDTRTWFRYHHFFAGFLRERLRRANRDLAPRLHLRASCWYEEQGLLSEAANHLIAFAKRVNPEKITDEKRGEFRADVAGSPQTFRAQNPRDLRAFREGDFVVLTLERRYGREVVTRFDRSRRD